MVFDAFLHKGLIFISNTAYVEQAAKTKHLTDTLDTLLTYRSKVRESVPLSKEADIIKLYLEFVQAWLEGHGTCQLIVEASELVRIRHCALLDDAMRAIDAMMQKEEVHELCLRVEEKPGGLLLRLFADGMERCDASAWIEVQV